MHQESSPLPLSPADRDALRSWVTGGTKVTRRLRRRAQAILHLSDGRSSREAARLAKATTAAIERWRERYLAEGPQGLLDRPRSGQPRKLADTAVSRILRITRDELPAESTRWSLRSLATRAETNPYQVRRVWSDAGLKPWREGTLVLSSDPHFSRTADAIGLYLSADGGCFALATRGTAFPPPTTTGLYTATGRGRGGRRTRSRPLYQAHDALQAFAGRGTSPLSLDGFLTDLQRDLPAGIDLHLVLDPRAAKQVSGPRTGSGTDRLVFRHRAPTLTSWYSTCDEWLQRLESDPASAPGTQRLALAIAHLTASPRPCLAWGLHSVPWPTLFPSDGALWTSLGRSIPA